MESSTFRFLDLPPEIRLKIYEYIFARETTSGISLRLARYISGGFCDLTDEEPKLSILQANRQLHEEAAKVLFHGVKTYLYLHSDRQRSLRGGSTFTCLLGPLESISLWTFITHLRFNLFIAGPAEYQSEIGPLLKQLAEAIEYGKHLQNLHLILIARSCNRIPARFFESMEALKVLRVPGEVKVSLVAEDLEGSERVKAVALCKYLEDLIKGLEGAE